MAQVRKFMVRIFIFGKDRREVVCVRLYRLDMENFGGVGWGLSPERRKWRVPAFDYMRASLQPYKNYIGHQE